MTGRRKSGWQITFSGIIALFTMWNLGCGNAQSQTGVLQAQETLPSIIEPGASPDKFQILATRALQDDVAAQDAAIMELRNLGQDAVDYLMKHHELRTSPRWATVLDKVAQQKDAQSSGLYWYTDLDLALAEARREKKPVLSLRLLGNLTDELSCANSRYFRTTLYPNPEVRELLANHFVLHWQWVRPAPIITIDFRDGRKIERTITGNSLHMVLDDQGRPVDVLPGLYAAGTFIHVLREAGPAAVRMSRLDDEQFRAVRANYHGGELLALQQSWDDHCKQANLPEAPPLGVDLPVEVWNKVAASAVPEPVISREVARVMAAHATAEAAGRLAAGKGGTEMPMLASIGNVSRLIKEDSVRNEYHLHARIHSWFANGQSPVIAQRPATNGGGSAGGGSSGSFGGRPGGGFGGQFGGAPSVPPVSLPGSQQDRADLEREPLVSRIYSELFLSPLNDPWYGLSKPDVYSAIKNDGRINAVTQNSRR